MVAEDHFVAAENGEVGFLVRTVRVVPEAAGTGDHKDPHGLDESIAPQGPEKEDVEVYESWVSVAVDAGEDISAGDDVGSCGGQVEESDHADDPHGYVDGCLHDRHDDYHASLSYELSSTLTHSNSESDSAKAADEQ